MALLQAGAGMEAATKASDCESPSGIDAQQASNVDTQGVTLTTSVASRSDQKRVILVRHAESTWNEWRKRTSLCNGDLCCCVMDPGFVDPALSGRGIRQCARLRDRVEAKKLLQRVDLIVCSPLGRALDTCKAGFAVGEPDGAERVVVTVDRHANTSAASVPLALDVAVRDGRIQPGHHVLLEGVGGGFAWGAVLVRFTEK